MARIAREAGISKALLYHYFPTKRDLFAATLLQAAEELRERTQPRPEASPAEALAESLDAFIAWIEERPRAYRRLIEGAASVPEVRAIVDEVRDRTAERISTASAPGPNRLRRCGRRCAAGSGSWTACCSTGSSARTWTAPP